LSVDSYTRGYWYPNPRATIALFSRHPLATSSGPCHLVFPFGQDKIGSVSWVLSKGGVALPLPLEVAGDPALVFGLADAWVCASRYCTCRGKPGTPRLGLNMLPPPPQRIDKDQKEGRGLVSRLVQRWARDREPRGNRTSHVALEPSCHELPS
jgi:hypothetical protein